MTLKVLQHYFHDQLDALYGKEEVSSFFGMLLGHYLMMKPLALAIQPNYEVSKTDEDRFMAAIRRLKKEEPIQYIIGGTEFMGLALKVNPHTLIPRPETEELVQWIITDAQAADHPQPTILDIGTGSGCIAIALAKYLPNAKIHALDISDDALKIARENALSNAVDIKFIESDILSMFANVQEFDGWNLEFGNLEFDLIVSNPPYVRELEKSSMKSNVLRYEPHLALFVKNDDPLLFYKAICGFAVHKLKSNGRLYFEINQYLGARTERLLAEFEFKSVELKTDVFGNDRMLKAIKP